MAERDRMSELPADILHIILGFLPIVQVARMAVLSTLFRDIWLRLTHIKFGYHFFSHFEKKYYYADNDIWFSEALYAINKILMQHNGGLIQKFVFDLYLPPRNWHCSQWIDFHQWLILVVQKGVEEIHIRLMPRDECRPRLPICIFSCPTVRRLFLCGGYVVPIYSQSTLPNVTSLRFEDVNIDGGNLLIHAPLLNILSFKLCYVPQFDITANKIDSLELYHSHISLFPVNLDMRSVHTLHLINFSPKEFVDGFTNRRELQLQPLELNVEHLTLSTKDVYRGGISSALIRLLRICPKLCKLDIDLWFDFNDVPKLWEELMEELREEFHIVGQRYKMLHTLKINKYLGGEIETLFIKRLLACFAALEKVVITTVPICDRDEDFEYNKEELLNFPCASTKVEIIFA